MNGVVLPRETVLRGWGEIAAALGMSEAMVRRLHQRRGLPVFSVGLPYENDPSKGGQKVTTGEALLRYFTDEAMMRYYGWRLDIFGKLPRRRKTRTRAK